jgi:uncharacterized protein YjbI with pentapeptide repeats
VANLERANLEFACLRRTTLSDANLKAANLRGAELDRANFSGADLPEANLSEAQLCGATFLHSNCNGALFDQAKLCRAKLSYSDFSGASLQGTDLVSANLMSVNWMAANLSGARAGGNQGLYSEEKQNLKQQGLQFIDEGVSDQAEMQSRLEAEMIWQIEAAKEDFRDRLDDLKDAYERSAVAVHALESSLLRLVEKGHLNQKNVTQMLQEYASVSGLREQDIGMYEAYLQRLDSVASKTLPKDFLEVLKGMHYTIQRLGDYKNYWHRYAGTEPFVDATEESLQGASYQNCQKL